jgi:hypothetical protein
LDKRKIEFSFAENYKILIFFNKISNWKYKINYELIMQNFAGMKD